MTPKPVPSQLYKAVFMLCHSHYYILLNNLNLPEWSHIYIPLGSATRPELLALSNNSSLQE